MEIIESSHWRHKKHSRKSIESYMIEYAVNFGLLQRDRHHSNALNAMVDVPQTGKTLKVVFRRIGKEKIKLITAYYLD